MLSLPFVAVSANKTSNHRLSILLYILLLIMSS
nr:MAG TPA: hypothetical protein [Caudoviricetes sp.]